MNSIIYLEFIKEDFDEEDLGENLRKFNRAVCSLENPLVFFDEYREKMGSLLQFHKKFEFSDEVETKWIHLFNFAALFNMLVEHPKEVGKFINQINCKFHDQFTGFENIFLEKICLLTLMVNKITGGLRMSTCFNMTKLILNVHDLVESTESIMMLMITGYSDIYNIVSKGYWDLERNYTEKGINLEKISERIDETFGLKPICA